MNRNALSIIRTTAFVLFVALIASYALFQSWKLIVGPVIDVYTPQNGATYSQTLIEIDGRAQNISFLTLDGRQIFTDENGYFKEKLLLSPGYNIITIAGTDKFKHTKTKTLEVVLKEY